MALNLELKQKRRFSLSTKSLGRIVCLNFTYGVYTKTEEFLKEKSNKVLPEEFTKYLTTLICQKSDSKNPKEKINQKQANILTKNEIDNFAKLFIENNEELLGEQQFIKKENEPHTEHLLRITKRYIKENSKIRKKMADNFKIVNFANFKGSKLGEILKTNDRRFGKIGNFSSLQNNLFSESTLSLIKKNQEISDRLGSAIQQKPFEFTKPELNAELYKPLKNPINKTNEILTTFGNKLKETSSLIKNMNDLGVSMVQDFKKSISTIDTWNKKMLRVGIGTLIVTFLATVFTAYFSYQNIEYSKKLSKQENFIFEQQNSLLKQQIEQQKQLIKMLSKVNNLEILKNQNTILNTLKIKNNKKD